MYALMVKDGVAISDIMQYNGALPGDGVEYILNEDKSVLESMKRFYTKKKDIVTHEVIRTLKCHVANQNWLEAGNIMQRYFNQQPCCSSVIKNFADKLKYDNSSN